MESICDSSANLAATQKLAPSPTDLVTAQKRGGAGQRETAGALGLCRHLRDSTSCRIHVEPVTLTAGCDVSCKPSALLCPSSAAYCGDPTDYRILACARRLNTGTHIRSSRHASFVLNLMQSQITSLLAECLWSMRFNPLLPN